MLIRSLLLQEHQKTFPISAQLSVDGNHGFRNDPILYLDTSCLAVADYCLMGRSSHTSVAPSVASDLESSLRLDPTGPEHFEACLRMKRCGAVRLTPTSWDWQGSCWTRLALHLWSCRYVFGWPPPAYNTSENRVVEPVWVYNIPQTSDVARTSDTIRHSGMEGLLGLDWLVGCSTMSDYCERLRIHGAVYYKDVRESPEAREMGLVTPASQLADM